MSQQQQSSSLAIVCSLLQDKSLSQNLILHANKFSRLWFRCEGLYSSLQAQGTTTPTFPSLANIELFSHNLMTLFNFFLKYDYKDFIKFIDILRRLREDLKLFDDYNTQIFHFYQQLGLNSRLLSPIDRYTEDSSDIEADFKILDDILMSFRSSNTFCTEKALLLRYAQEDLFFLTKQWNDSKKNLHVITNKIHSLSDSLKLPISPEESSDIVKEIQIIRCMLEDTSLSPQLISQITILLSYLNDSLEAAINGSFGLIQEILLKKFQKLELSSSRIESNTDEILQLLNSHLLSNQSQLLRNQLLSRLSLPLEEVEYNTSILLGEGGYASVYRGTFRGAPVAIKVIKNFFSDLEKSTVENEVLLMDLCKSPHMLRVYGFLHVQSVHPHSFICMDLASFGPLSNILYYHPLPESLIMAFLFDIISALEFIHSKRIIHRDIKIDNILLDGYLLCKLTDFGLAKEQLHSNLAYPSKVSGATAFVAPEIIFGEGSNHRSDIYSFGITALHLICGSIPDRNFSTSEKVRVALISLSSSINAEMESLLSSCLSKTPINRSSACEVRSRISDILVSVGGDPRNQSCHKDQKQIADIATQLKSRLGERHTLDVIHNTLEETELDCHDYNEGIANWLKLCQDTFLAASSLVNLSDRAKSISANMLTLPQVEEFVEENNSGANTLPSQEFNLLDVFDETGISSVRISPQTNKEINKLLSLANQSLTEMVRVGDDVQIEAEVFSYREIPELPVTSLLSNKDSFTSFSQALKRHHRWIRIFTYRSLQKSRFIRLLVVSSDIICILFATTLFYHVSFPDDQSCQEITDESNCTNTRSILRLGKPLCVWDNFCESKPPPFTLFFIVGVSMIVLVLSMPFRKILQLILERACSKIPTSLLATQNSNENDSTEPDVTEKKLHVPAYPLIGNKCHVYHYSHYDLLSVDHETQSLIWNLRLFFTNTLLTVPFPWREYSLTNDALISHRHYALMNIMMKWMNVYSDGTPVKFSLLDTIRFCTPVSQMTSTIAKVRRMTLSLVSKLTDESNIAVGQSDYQNNFLLQEFMLEQLSPICQYALKRYLYNRDTSLPGHITFIIWIFCWIFVVAVTGCMSFWLIYWFMKNDEIVVNAWCVIVCVILYDCIINECFQIYVLDVLVINKLRPQIQQIYQVFDHAMQTRLYGYIPNQDLRIIQHISSACRAARTPQLNQLIASNILAVMDDADLDFCRSKRLTEVLDIGIISYMTLYFPACLTNCNEIFQQASLDIFFCLGWCCFILVNYLLSEIHPALLSVFYLFLLLIVIFLIFIAPSDQFKHWWHNNLNKTDTSWREINNITSILS